MSLEEEIASQRAQIHSTSYEMSIGELISLYRDGELEIHPEFQRLYRWTDSQKTSLIESIFLNIPIPPIFVSQNEKCVWDVIDGVQRLSTIFEFVGVYKDAEGHNLPGLELQKTEYLPSFEGKKWFDVDITKSLSQEQRLDFKRSRIGVIIIKKESDPRVKYELFQRINTGGSSLSPQEVRNCLMVMMNSGLYQFLSRLSKDDNFQKCVQISDRKEDEQYRMELILKLIIASGSYSTNYSDLCDLLDKETMLLCENDNFNKEDFETKFKGTFQLIYDAVQENAFKRFKDGRFCGAFLSSAFQSIAVGVFSNFENIIKKENYIKNVEKLIQGIYCMNGFDSNMKPGVSPLTRFKSLSAFGIDYFS